MGLTLITKLHILFTRPCSLIKMIISFHDLPSIYEHVCEKELNEKIQKCNRINKGRPWGGFVLSNWRVEHPW